MRFIVSIIMILGALWGGAYCMHTLPDWCMFPVFTTAGLVLFVGLGLFASSATKGRIMRIGILIGSGVTYEDKPAFLIVWFGEWALAIGRKAKEAK